MSDTESIQKATEYVKKAHEIVKDDPYRPRYHFIALANWMNDPNGPIFYKDEYHMFYQHNPYEPFPRNIHWGHAKSKDLVYWEHLPIALAPSIEKGEAGCWSGCCVNNNGVPTIFYTSVKTYKPPGEYAEQWMAISTDNMMTWEKYKGNPILSPDIHGDLEILDWRDPYVWREDKEWFMILGGHTKESKKTKKRAFYRTPAAFLYRSRDLIKWEFVNPLCYGEGKVGRNWECPNFFPLGNKHILIVSPHRRVIYNIGIYENYKFKQDKWHLLDYGKSFYAPNTMFDEKGRLIMWGWIKGAQDGFFEMLKGNTTGWNGCLTLPRILSLRDDNTLDIRPASELEDLRNNHQKFTNIEIKNYSSFKINTIKDNCYELIIEIKDIKAKSLGFRLFKDDNGENNISLIYDITNKIFYLDKEKIEIEFLNNKKESKLHIFIDRSVIEIYANYRNCFTGRVYSQNINATDIEIFVREGSITIEELTIWELKSIWDEKLNLYRENNEGGG